MQDAWYLLMKPGRSLATRCRTLGNYGHQTHPCPDVDVFANTLDTSGLVEITCRDTFPAEDPDVSLHAN
jgi:hypothetical protein